MQRVIVNADDFGLNEHCSKAIAQAFERGLVTNATIIANGEYFDEAVLLCNEKGFYDRIGIHFNLYNGEPLTDDIKKCRTFVSDGRFHGKISRTKPLSKKEKAAVYKELTAQIKKVKNAGIKVTHADSHHHIHTGIFIAPVFSKVCKENGIGKVRLHRNIGKISPVKRIVKKIYNIWLHANGFATVDYFGSLYDIKYADVADKTEIMVHPDYDARGILIDRTGETDGIPSGERLPDLKLEKGVTFSSYGEL